MRNDLAVRLPGHASERGSGDRKELFYFDFHYARGESWYRGHFPTRRELAEAAARHGEPSLTGEASPSYFLNPACPERIARFNPEMKLILLLRNPTEQALSAYHFGIRRGAYTETSNPLEEGFRAQHRYLAEKRDEELTRPDTAHHGGQLVGGVYLPFLKQWHAFFPAGSCSC